MRNYEIEILEKSFSRLSSIKFNLPFVKLKSELYYTNPYKGFVYKFNDRKKIYVLTYTLDIQKDRVVLTLNIQESQISSGRHLFRILSRLVSELRKGFLHYVNSENKEIVIFRQGGTANIGGADNNKVWLISGMEIFKDKIPV